MEQLQGRAYPKSSYSQELRPAFNIAKSKVNSSVFPLTLGCIPVNIESYLLEMLLQFLQAEWKILNCNQPSEMEQKDPRQVNQEPYSHLMWVGPISIVK